MNRIFLFTLLILSALGTAYGQECNSKGIVFDTLTHDFGLLEKGSNASYNFSFVNRDENPVIITNVKSSCGCTVTKWTREPVQQGASGSIMVKYNTKITGTFQKTIFVHTNPGAQATALTIKGTVKKGRKKR